MNAKKVLAASLAATMMFGLAGCAKSGSSDTGSSNGGAMTIKVWSPQEYQSAKSGKWLQKECEAFAKEHKDWKINFKYGVCSEGDAGKLVTQDAKAAADVYMFANDQLGTLLDAKAIAQLGGDALKDVQNNNTKALVDSVTSDGKVYGLPFTGNTWFMYYDKTAFSDQDVKSLDTMLSKGKVAFPVSNSWYLGSFYVANGGTLFGDGTDKNACVQFGGENGYATTKYLVDLVNNPNFENDADGKGLTDFRKGTVKAMFSGSWDYDAVKKALGDKLCIAQLPTVNINGQAKQLKSFSGSKAVAVNPNSKNMQASIALARYLAGEKAQEDHYKLRSIIPCNTTLLKNEEVAKDPLVTAQNNTINNTSIVQPTISAMGNYWTPTETFGKNLIAKKVTAANYKAETDKFVKSLNTDAVK